MSRLPFMRNLLDPSSVAQSLAAAPLSSIIAMMRPAMPVMVRSPMRSIVLAVMPAVPPIPVEPICAARSGGRNANHGAHRNANRDVAGNTRSLGQPQRRSLQLLGEARRLIVLSTSTIQGAFSFSETARPHIMMPFLYRWPILNGRIVVHSSVIHH
jgi:hypothetical protein